MNTVNTPAPNPGKRGYHHGDLAGACLRIGLQVLVDSGPEALSLREVARRLGVSANAPYRHYADREALLRAMAAEGFRRLAEAFREGSAQPASPDLDAIGDAYLAFAEREPALFRLMFSGRAMPSPESDPAEDHGDGVRSHADSCGAEADEAFQLLMAAVAARHPEETRDEVVERSMAAWAMIHGAATLILEGIGRFGDRCRAAQIRTALSNL